MKFIDGLQLVLIVLKIIGVIEAGWFVVLIPFWIKLVLYIVVAILRAKDDIY